MEGPAVLFKDFADVITQEDIELALPLVKQVPLEKGSFLLREGDVCDDVSFIAEGIAVNYILENGKEKIVHVSLEGEFSTALYSFYSRAPSEVYIKALTDMQVYRIGYAEVQFLYNKSKNWERVGRLFAERSLIKVIRNRYDIQHKDARQRYEELIDRKPELLQLLSLGQIANILGITQETLSRIRAKR
jgi:CRP-like cAMP-binding protein